VGAFARFYNFLSLVLATIKRSGGKCFCWAPAKSEPQNGAVFNKHCLLSTTILKRLAAALIVAVPAFRQSVALPALNPFCEMKSSTDAQLVLITPT